MRCLLCGGCCKLMSPKSAPFRCPDLIRRDGLYFCRAYDRSPELCRRFNHEGFEFCPYGLNELGLSVENDRAELEDRVARGVAIIQTLGKTPNRADG